MGCWVVLDLDFKHKCNRPAETLLRQALKGRGEYKAGIGTLNAKKQINDDVTTGPGARSESEGRLPGRFMSSYAYVLV